MKTKYKLYDTVLTSQDYSESYTGTIVDIKRYPHPHSSNQKDMTWYTITTPRLNTYGKNYTFITNDIEHILTTNKEK